MTKGITQKMADEMVMYRIIGRDSYVEFTHGPDRKSYAQAVEEIQEYRKSVNSPSSDTIYTLIEVTCKVLSV